MGNRRRNQRPLSRKLQQDRHDLLNGDPGEPSRGRRKSNGRAPHAIDDEWQTLNAQIGALESFLTGAAAKAERQRRQKLQNILPPPDRADLPRQHGQRMSRWQERNHYDERQRHGVTFFLLFCAVCALLWWLLHASTTM